MFPHIILNGVSSKTINGLLIQNLPPITKPEMRVDMEEIDGRDGDIITDLGYSAYDKSFEIGITDKSIVNQVIGFLNSEGTVTFSNEPTMVYQYKIVKQIDFERLLRFKTASVTMHVQPFKKCLTEKELTFSGAEQKIKFIDYYAEKNGVVATCTDGVLTFEGTSTQNTTFFVPIENLKLDVGNYRLDVYSSGITMGCESSLVNDSLAFSYCFGEALLNLLDNSTVSTTATYDTFKPFNNIYVNIPGGFEANFSLYTKLTLVEENKVSIINKGNVYSLPKITIYGVGDINLGVNEEDAFYITLVLEEYITIDTTNLEAVKDGVLKNRLVTGNYDNFELKYGVNTINYDGIVEKIIVNDYSRWL
jgi:phage-related protein